MQPQVEEVVVEAEVVPQGYRQRPARTQARVYAVTQQDANAAPDVVTSIISILDHDAYTLVDPGTAHSFASKHFLDRFRIKTQPL